MNGFRFSLAIVAPLLLFVACGRNPRFEPPIAKTNPNPAQGYEITVELVDPPADIRSIAGEAHFGVSSRACLPYQDRIARVTIGTSYIKKFALTQVGENTYQGRIFLDWPIDEDYYGLGVCKWKIATVDAVFTRDDRFVQASNLIWHEITSEASNLSYCRRAIRGEHDKFCSAPIDPLRIETLSKVSYQVKMSSRKD